MLRVFLAGCDPVLSNSVRKTFLAEGAFEVCVERRNGIEAIIQAIKVFPDLIILGKKMRTTIDLGIAEALKITLPEAQIFLLTDLYGMETEREALSHGIDAVFEIHDDLTSLLMNAREICGLRGSQAVLN
jgi:chemotaxis response regulator CheB